MSFTQGSVNPGLNRIEFFRYFNQACEGCQKGSGLVSEALKAGMYLDYAGKPLNTMCTSTIGFDVSGDIYTHRSYVLMGSSVRSPT